MAKINPYNPREYSFAVGGDGYSTFVQDIPSGLRTRVLGPSASGSEQTGGPTWYNRDQLLVQYYNTDVTPRLVLVSVRDGTLTVLLMEGVVDYCSGGGQWSARTVNENFYINGKPEGNIFPICYGPNGTLAYTHWKSKQGLWLRTNNQNVHLSDGVVFDVTVLGTNQATWKEGNKIKSSWGMEIKNLPGGFSWVRSVIINGMLHVMYLAEGINKVVLHPWNSFIGWVIGSGPCYYPDLFYNGELLIVYSASADDLNQTLSFNAHLTDPMDLESLFDSKPPDPEPPDPEEPDMEIQAPNEIETVREVMEDHPEIDTMDEEERGKIIDYTCVELNPPNRNKPWGRKARQSDGSDKNTDGLTYLRTDGKFEIIDIISGTDGSATWDHKGIFAQGENGYWAPHDPVDSEPVDPEEPEPEPEPKPEEDFTGDYSILGIGYKFGRVSDKELLFDLLTENPDGLFRLDKLGDKYTIKHVNTGRFLGADNTKYGLDICKQFYTVGVGQPLGNYESWSVFRTPGDLVIAVIEYIEQGAELAPFTSAALTLKIRN